MTQLQTRSACWQVLPRPLTDRDFWTAARQAPRLADLWRDVLDQADQAPDRPTMPSASDYLAARRFQDRGRVDNVWQHTRRTLGALALRRAALGLDPSDPDDRLLDWLWAFATQPTWVVSAHLPDKDLPATGALQADLAACEMAATLAEMIDVLGPWMDSVSSTLRPSIVEEIDRRLLRPYGDGATVHWQPGHGNQNNHLNNWLGVCAGNILAACESLATHGQPRPQARDRAIEGLRIFFDRCFTESGECDEGMGYWGYGVGMAVLGLSRLNPDEVVDRFDIDRIARVADYPRRAHLFDDVFFSGNDAPLHCQPGPAYVPWLAALTGNDWLAAWAARSAGNNRGGLSSLVRILAIPQDAVPASPPDLPAPPPARLLPDQQTALLQLTRPGDAGELVATLSGGTNGERHNHNDLGHFIIALDRKLIVPDLGNLHYKADFFGPNRYSYRAAASWGHNCPVVAGHEQRVGSEAAGAVLKWDENTPSLSLDLTAAYPPEAALSRWTRSLMRDGDAFLLVDEYQTAQPRQPIVHVVWSLEQPRETGDGAVMLGRLNLAVSPAAPLQVQPHNPADLLLREFNDRTLYRLEWRFTTDDTGALRVETRFE